MRSPTAAAATARPCASAVSGAPRVTAAPAVTQAMPATMTSTRWPLATVISSVMPMEAAVAVVARPTVSAAVATTMRLGSMAAPAR